MEFDESKVRSEWSDELEGKKGWFSDYINRGKNIGLSSYIKNNDESSYGICHKGEVDFPFKSNDRSNWKYFYPDNDTVVFNKNNLFIAGYNDNLLHTGDMGYTGDSVSYCASKLTGYWTQHILTGCSEKGFTTDADAFQHQFFYRTKCVPNKKYIAWTKDNFPLNVLDLVKDNDNITFIGAIKNDKSAVWIGGASCAISLQELFDYWELPDGTPCGQEVTE